MRVPFGTDLILPFPTVALVEAPILPTGGANCKVTIWSPSPTSMGSWSKEPRNNEFIESELQNWVLAKWTVVKVGLHNN